MGLVDHEYLSNITKDDSTVSVRDTIKNRLKDISFEKSNLKLRECFIDKYGTLVLKFCGGLNGNGNWSDYFNDLENLVSYIASTHSRLWLIQLDNDVIDDVFDAYFGCKLD